MTRRRIGWLEQQLARSLSATGAADDATRAVAVSAARRQAQILDELEHLKASQPTLFGDPEGAVKHSYAVTNANRELRYWIELLGLAAHTELVDDDDWDNFDDVTPGPWPVAAGDTGTEDRDPAPS
jgi:hypothetical protein